MFRKPLVLGLASVLAISALAGCGSKKNDPGTGGNKTGDTTKKESVIRYNAGADFRSLDPAIMTDLVSFSAENQLFEGLTRITAKGIEGGMAATWDPSTDGLKYTFHLRDGLKWSNGDALTAEDFVYAWQRALDPRTGSEYAYQLYYLKGGQKLNEVALKKKDGDKEVENPNAAKEIEAAMKDLGVKATDPKTLEVMLEAPTPYFLGLTSFPTYHPVDKKVVSANKDWAAKPETYVSNGPFKLTKWEHKQVAVLEKNPNYWDAGTVKLNKLEYYMIEEASTYLNSWETGQLDFIETPPAPELARLQKEGKLKVSPSYGTYYYNFNTKAKPFDNPKVRKALAMAINRKDIVQSVARGGQKPAYAFVSYGSPDVDVKADYRDVGGDNLIKEDVAEAKRLLAEAGYPDGKGFPAVSFIYNTNELHKAVAEAVIEMWKKNLGITTITMENTEWKIVLDKRHKGDYTIARAGWYGDYLDPMTFMDLYVTGGGNNDVFWSNTSFDKLIADTKATASQQVRMKNMHDAEKIMMDEMPVMPIFYYNYQYLMKDNITGVYHNPLGIIDFKTAEVK